MQQGSWHLEDPNRKTPLSSPKLVGYGHTWHSDTIAKPLCQDRNWWILGRTPGVTSHTHLPNRSSNPSVMDVCRCVPLSDSHDQLVALVLDVAKPHRRVFIRPSDRGLLCFRHRGRLFQCLTLNFGARVSSFCWARAAGLLLRLLKRLIRIRHSGVIYVDDILSLLNRLSAPLCASPASVIVILLLCIKVPMGWHRRLAPQLSSGLGGSWVSPASRPVA